MDYATFTAMSSGFTLGLSLILAIGAQNAFVLQKGLLKEHVFWVCACCAISDSILISAGIAGFGSLVEAYPSIETIARIGGVTFLCVYGVQKLYAALKGHSSLEAAGQTNNSLGKTIAITLAFTWLNPHVYLDTVALLGSISTQYEDLRFYFGLGAVIASFTFFFSLGYGAQFLRPIFEKALAWRILDALIGVLMLLIAISLL